MKTLFFTLSIFISFNNMASIVCHTPRMNKNFEISNNKISFFNDSSLSKNREIASVMSRNKSEQNGVTKIVEFENQKHTIHIENSNNFSDVEDYIIIRNKAGHEMTYPLTCTNK